ncbi:MAG: hypothetical protein M3498_18760 [Deinococcota bacterium]|jgi:outer membrane lipoprotein-sorting protein|nr:hypothetical protein [Deinococcota bacterium]
MKARIMKALRLLALLLLSVLLAGCVCAPAAVPLTGAPSEAEVAQARQLFGAPATSGR